MIMTFLQIMKDNFHIDCTQGLLQKELTDMLLYQQKQLIE